MSLKITVVGLASGGEDQLTLGIWRKLQSRSHIYENGSTPGYTAAERE